ncbi:MAG: hypothetical protein V7642_678 [Burkholderiales bacterium]|jgi:hypothetical protein
MWSLVMITALAALTGFYTTVSQQASSVAENRKAMELAENMALYREAVIRYYTAHDVTNASASMQELKAEKVIPEWSTLYTDTAAPLWGNYRDAGGMIYVYATRLPPVNIASEMAELSRYSYFAGSYQQAGMVLKSPKYGNTGISLAALAGRSVPDNAPVWLGRRR